MSRREQILALAAEFFTTRGYHGTGVDEIGQAAGISGPALYRHFANKQALLDAVVTDGMRVLLDEATAIVAADAEPSETLQRLIEMRVEFAFGPHRFVFPLHRGEERNVTDQVHRQLSAMSELYRSEWMRVLTRVRPKAPTSELHTAFYAAHALIGFTAHHEHGVEPPSLKRHLIKMANAVLMTDA
jgi:AcrR family transcriptional regulator